ncbi:MAG TPA: AtpZ/AtpI family protein [Acidimicrobiales bacterium]|jgi:F0F1-type ATP synthase assembly protein I|nr:AtpZ/AtpI family protein [Acidimicrobiales bacterium]
MHTLDLRDWRDPLMSSRDEQRRAERSYLRYLGSGLEFFSTVAVLTFLGVWVDSKLGTSPTFTIVLALVGFAAATWMLVRSVFSPSQLWHKGDDDL